MRPIIIFLGALALAPSPAFADVDHDSELWLSVGASGRISGRLLGSLDAVARFSEDDDGIYEAQFGGFLGYQATDRVALWVGYTRNPRYRRGSSTIVEDRTRQQITADLGKLLGGSVTSRVRLEQRFRDVGGTGWRLRGQVKFARPFAVGGPSFVASHESFVALNDTGWGQRGGYERMRNFAGIGLPFTKRVRAEVGYVNQYSRRAGDDTMDHAASVALGYSF